MFLAGYFKDIALSADWYSANTVLQRPGKTQITDLKYAQPIIEWGTSDAGEWIGCSGLVMTEAGYIKKGL